MQGFTIVDGVVAVVIILSAVLAYSRGLTREILAIAGWIVAAVLAFTFAHQAEPLIKEIPVLGEFLKGSCELSIIAAFTAVFAIGLIVMSFFTPLFASVVRNSLLGGLDQGLGFLFGVLRGLLLVAVAFLVYQRTMAAETIPMVNDSRSAKIFAQFEGQMNNEINNTNFLSWVQARYEQLVGTCGAPASGGVTGGSAVPAPAAPATDAPATNAPITSAPVAPSTDGTTGGTTGN